MITEFLQHTSGVITPMDFLLHLSAKKIEDDAWP